MNIFEIPQGDIDYILQNLGKDVLINSIPARALVTNTNLNLDYDDKKIATIEPLATGSIIEYLGQKFIVLSEVNGPRNKLYKALMRRTNAVMHIQVDTERILVGYDDLGRPVYQENPIYSDFPIFMNQKAIDIAGNQIMLPEGRINVIMQAVDEDAIATNAIFEADVKQWKIIDIDTTKTGIFQIVADRNI